jgi:hypothetical protein
MLERAIRQRTSAGRLTDGAKSLFARHVQSCFCQVPTPLFLKAFGDILYDNATPRIVVIV